MAHRGISDLTGGPPPAPSSIFGPEDDNIVPGEIVFALEADAATDVQVSIATAPSGRGTVTGGEVTSLGASAVDKALGRLDVQAVSRVHGPTPTEVVAGIAMASDLGLDTTMRVRYDADQSPEDVAKKLNKLGEVAWAEPNRWREATVVPNDPQFGSQWGLTKINCPQAWDSTTGDSSIVVAVLDTGVDLNHPELAPLLLPGQDLVDFPPGSTPRPGWVFEGDFTGVDAVPQDEVGHGTHVAGTIACATNNGVGVAGVAWNVGLLPVRVLARIRNTATGRVSGSGSAANIAAGIRWAVDNGARVINMSLGGYADTTVEREAIAYAVSRGVVVVAAMANDNTGEPAYPAAYPGVIAVGATDSGDSRAEFSNFGNWIDVAAPGVDIQSTYWDDTYASLSGTSMATPHVAGVAALILSRNNSLTADQVGNIIRTTAKPLQDDPAEAVPNDKYGHGLLQADAAVKAAGPVLKPKIPPELIRSRLIGCSEDIFCSQRVICGKSPLIGCPPSLNRLCESKLVLCRDSLVTCRLTQDIGCRPPSLADCPSLPCPERRWRGGDPFEAGGQEYDPHGYDPYEDKYE